MPGIKDRKTITSFSNAVAFTLVAFSATEFYFGFPSEEKHSLGKNKRNFTSWMLP